MADKFRGKYRIPSARWAAWDYSSNAAYFITICTQGRVHAFGRIVDSDMNVSPLGQAAVDCWQQIPDHFPFVRLGEFVVMPNHVHGIIVIAKDTPVETHVETQNPVETQNFASLQTPKNQFGPQSQNLASIVRGYKIGVTKFARANALPFSWQPRYYDRVIRDLDEYERIATYILTNPANWQSDTLFGLP